MGWHRIIEADGIGLGITGMLIVFIGLVLVTIFIYVVPRVIEEIEERQEKNHRMLESREVAQESTSISRIDDRVLAAITFVVNAESERLGLERHRITIARDDSQNEWVLAGHIQIHSNRL